MFKDLWAHIVSVTMPIRKVTLLDEEEVPSLAYADVNKSMIAQKGKLTQ